MAQQGWIKIHRKLKECYLWDDKEPFDKRSAWIDLLLSANHADKKTLMNNEAVLILRGSFITSEVKLSERWKWDRGKTRRFLKLLENDNMIKKTPTSRLYITIEIMNYELYQGATSESIDTTDLEPYDTTSREQVENKYTTSREQVTNINKNDKELNKNSKNEKKPIVYNFSDNKDLNQTIKDFMIMRKQLKKPMTDKAVKLMLNNLDKLSSNDADKIEILNQSIQNSWIGIFPLKDNRGGGNGGNTINNQQAPSKFANFKVKPITFTEEELREIENADVF